MFPGLGSIGLQCGRRTRVEMDEKFVTKKTIREANLTTDKPNCDHQGSDRARQSDDSRYSVWHGAFGEIAVAFIAPAAAIACFAVARRKHVRRAAPAALLLVVFAAPPYPIRLVENRQSGVPGRQ